MVAGGACVFCINDYGNGAFVFYRQIAKWRFQENYTAHILLCFSGRIVFYFFEF